jgi:hypothetical protein
LTPLGLASCHFESGGLEALFDGYASYINFPGDRLATGHFSRLRLDGDNQHGAYLVALENGQELTLVPLAGGAPCRVGTVSRHQIFRSGPEVSSMPAPVVAYLESSDDQGRGPLSFVGPDCSRWSTGLTSAELPRFAARAAYLVRDTRPEGDALVAVDPWNRVTHELGTRVADLQVDGETRAIWSIEGGQSVVRDSDLTELERFGTGVTELVLLGKEQAAIVDAGVLSLVSEGGTVTPVATDACGSAAADPWNTPRDCLGYLAPCAEQTPNIYQVSTGSYFAFEGFGTPPGVNAPPLVTDWSSPRQVFFLTGAEKLGPTPGISSGPSSHRGYVGTLWSSGFTLGTSSPVTVERRAERALLSSILSCRWGDYARMLVDYDGTTGRLVEWQLSQMLELATGVSEFSGCLAIASFDGTRGDLLAVPEGPRVLAHGVPGLQGTSGVGSATNGLAVLSEYDGTTGTLLVFTGSPWNGLSAAAETIARGVPLGGFDAFLDFPALGYLHDFDPALGAGTLAVRFLPSQDTFERPGVSEWTQVTWPADGVVYAVPNGAEAGVYYAKAK